MPLHQYLPQDRLSALARGIELPGRAEGAALFADISGFTAMTEALRSREGERRGIELLSRRINAIFDALLAEVQAQAGSVIGFAGDAVTCWFDAVDGPAAPRAVLAARRMQEAMARFPDLALKVCVGSGPARRFTVGHPDVQRMDVLAGSTLNRVAAADALARPGELLVDEAIARDLALPHVALRAAAGGDSFAVLDLAAPWPSALDQPEAPPNPPLPLPDVEALRRWVLPFVFERETAGEDLFVNDLRPATAVFVRFSGLDFNDDGQGATQLDDLVAEAQLALDRHGGVLLEVTVGDKGCYLYGNFGAAQVHEDDPARAVRAAVALRQAWTHQDVALQVGISSGTMRVGGYGGSTRQSFGAIGDDVNTAARLMGLAASGEILVSGRSRQALGEEFELEARPPMQAKGKAEPMPVFAVLRARQRRAIRLQEPSWNTPIVGRAAEVARLAQGVASARAGRGRLIGLVAEAGMGKSRLLAEGVRLALADGFIGYGGSCSMDGVRTPYLVWQPIWSAFFDVDPGLPVRRQMRAIEQVLQQHAPLHADAWPLLGAVLGRHWPDNDFTRALPPRDRRAVLEALLLRCLQTAAEEATEDGVGLLLVLEDLHAADPLSLDLLNLVAKAIEHLPVLVLLSLRPEAGQAPPATDALPAAPLHGLAHYEQITLGALSPAHIEQVIHAKLGTLFPERSGSLNTALIGHIVERAQGNPFYVGELLSYLADRGLDPRSADRASLLELPASLHSLVLSRIDRLPLVHRQALKVASVVGREFTAQALLDYYPALGDSVQVAHAMRDLNALGLTSRDAEAAPDDTAARQVFQHRVTQEVAYESLTGAARTELHGRYADHLLRREAAGQPVRTAELAHHFERAERPALAARYLRLAGEEAAERYANDEALDLLQRALRHLPAQAGVERYDLLLQCEAVLALQGRHEERQQHLLALDRLAATLPDAGSAQAQVAVRRARLQIDEGDHAAAAASAAQAIAWLEPAAAAPGGGPAAHLLVDALREQARTEFFGGDARATRPQLDRALSIARAHGYRRGEINILSLLGLVHWHTGEFEPAQARLHDALQLMDADGDVRRQLDTQNNLGVIAAARGQHAQALAHYEAALAMARRIGDRNGEAMLRNNMGDVCLARCDFHQAMLHTTSAARLYHEAGEPVSRGAALLNLAAAQAGLGQDAAAHATSLQALDLLRRGRQRRGEAAVLCILSGLALARQQTGDAEAHARAALALARDIGSPAAACEALRDLGRALTASGRRAEAADVLDEAARTVADLASGPMALEVAAARAECTWVQGDPQTAHRALQVLPDLLGVLLPTPQPIPQPTDADRPATALPAWVWLVAWQCLQAAGDSRAPGLRAAARDELLRRAAALTDARSRGDFLAIPVHQALLAARPAEGRDTP